MLRLSPYCARNTPMKVYGSVKNTDFTRTSSVTCEKYAALFERKADSTLLIVLTTPMGANSNASLIGRLSGQRVLLPRAQSVQCVSAGNSIRSGLCKDYYRTAVCRSAGTGNLLSEWSVPSPCVRIPPQRPRPLVARCVGVMPVSIERLREELSVFDFSVNLEDEDLSEKLVELCSVHRLSEEAMVDEWMAFSTTRNLPLSVANLCALEHEVLNRKILKRPNARKEKHCGNRDINSIQELIEVETEEENLLDSYTTPAKGSQKRILSTPENPQSKRVPTRSPHLLFSPATFSPSATPSQKYSSRSNRGEVVTSFGDIQGTSWSGGNGKYTKVEPITLQEEEALTKSYKYMFQKLTDIRDAVGSKIEELGEALKNYFHIEEFTSVSFPAQETVTVLGQIGCDSNGKLNSKSVILEGDREHSSGMQVPVDLSELKEYSLFPGQVVVMEGTNSSGRKFVASKLYEGVTLPYYQPNIDSEGKSEELLCIQWF
ncbi:unnamed protein product [Ranitomeya imitator]|uniref:DNA polymerase alpha subunit B n=1 Tax=Ranitomeya imitator TaxID=111125 RepID=A0ABN9MJG9_9NEOB|nr:unnamed protein product [Ranitomeya imitator]